MGTRRSGGKIATLILVAAAVPLVGHQLGGAVEKRPQPKAAEPVNLRYGIAGVKIWPESANDAEIGVPYRWGLYTHCGLDKTGSPDFDGSLWDFQGPGPAHVGGNPPPGFGNPFDQGTMTLVSENVAEYRTSSGKVIRYSRHVGPMIVRMCL